MPVEQRVVSRQKIGVRASSAPAAPVAPAEPEQKAGGRSRRPLVVVVAVVVLLAAGAAWWFLGRGGGDAAAPEPEPTRVAGEVLQVEPISINLADGHYLRLGLGLQLTADAEGAPDPAKALDLAIALYSGRSMAEIADPATRENLKVELARQLDEAYEGAVMDVYLTNYVTQ